MGGGHEPDSGWPLETGKDSEMDSPRVSRRECSPANAFVVIERDFCQTSNLLEFQRIYLCCLRHQFVIIYYSTSGELLQIIK